MDAMTGQMLAARMRRDRSIIGPVCGAFAAALRGEFRQDPHEYVIRHYGDDGELVEETKPRQAYRLALIYGRSRWPQHRIELWRRPVGSADALELVEQTA